MENEYQSSTPETDGDLLAAVRRQELPDTVIPLIDTYDETIADRDRFLWRWLYHIFPTFRLSCVDDDRAQSARDAKFLASMFVTVADDVAERRGDRATFGELAMIPFDHRRPDPDRRDVDGDVVRFLTDLWEQFSTLYDAGPRGAEFAELLQFDLQQALQAIEYSYLVNHSPDLVSERELWTYDVHNMLVFALADIDLSNAPSFDSTELSLLRRVLDRSQRMARIGNWVSTWERELAEGDWSSGVVVHAIENDIVSPEQIAAIRQTPTDEAVASVVETVRESDVEDYFLDRWRTEYAAVEAFDSQIESVDIGAYLEGLETLLASQLASRGQK